MDCNIPDEGKKRIVIVGGGFAGLQLINRLKKTGYQLVLIDKNNYHQFPPLLYQVATAGLESNSISFPYRKMFQKQSGFYFRLGQVQAVDYTAKMIHTSIGDLSYDYLVLAAGTETNFYGNEQIKKKSLPMKSMVEALELRNTLLSNLEKATLCEDEKEKQALLTIVVAGGGATGVEIAGALAEMKKFVIPKDYQELSPLKLNIHLVEGMDRVLGPMSKDSSANALKSLQKMGVDVILNKKVSGYDGEVVSLEDGQKIMTKTFIWVSGVSAIRFGQIEKESMGKGNRLLVDEFNQVKGMNDVFAVGDICLMTTDPDYPNGHPQVAQVAIQQGHNLARNLKRIKEGRPMEPFHYKNLGTLATIGRNKAVADIGKFRMHGFPAWTVWLLVHLRSILGVKNKLIVLLDWIWNYFSYDQSERYIMFVPPQVNDEPDLAAQQHESSPVKEIKSKQKESTLV